MTGRHHLRRDPGHRRLPRAGAADALAVALFVALALVVTAGLWRTGGSAATADNTRDHAQFLFFFEHAAYAVVNLRNPLFTDVMGAPYGVNLMANTAFLGMAVPLAPVTILAGPGVSYALALTIALAGTATAWYVVLRRYLTTDPTDGAARPSRPVAFAAAALAGFSPGLVGHGNGHPNISAQFLLPLIVAAVIRLRTTPSPVRTGLLLGLLVTLQVFLNEELLMFTVMACAVMVVVFVASRPAQARAGAGRFLAGIGVALGVAAVLTAYPLWFQFTGPQHYRGPFAWAPLYWTDVAAYPAYGSNAIAGRLGSASLLNGDPGETNAFLGLPLCVFALVTAVALWRVLAVRIAAVVAALFLLLSFGDDIIVNGQGTSIPGPWRLVGSLPLFDAVITPRLALVVVPAIAVLFAVGAHRLVGVSAAPVTDRTDVVGAADGAGGPDRTDRSEAPDERAAQPGERRWRAVAWGALAAVLLPLVPTPLRTTTPEPVPVFFTAGTWRRYVGAGTVVPVPPDGYSEATLRALVGLGGRSIGAGWPRFVDGYFLGPGGPDEPQARYGPPEQPTALLLAEVAETGAAPEITEDMRATALADLRHWGADAVVLAPQIHQDVLRTTVDGLLGRPGEAVDGVWVWDVRDLVP